MLNPLNRYDRLLKRNKVRIDKPKTTLRHKLGLLLKYPLYAVKRLYGLIIKPLNALPNGLYFVLFIAFCFVLFGFFIGHERKVQNAFISDSCPSMINQHDVQGNLVKLSPYDKFITEFNSTQQAVHFTTFSFMFWALMGLVWRSTNPEKPQIFTKG